MPHLRQPALLLALLALAFSAQAYWEIEVYNPSGSAPGGSCVSENLNATLTPLEVGACLNVTSAVTGDLISVNVITVSDTAINFKVYNATESPCSEELFDISLTAQCEQVSSSAPVEFADKYVSWHEESTTPSTAPETSTPVEEPTTSSTPSSTSEPSTAVPDSGSAPEAASPTSTSTPDAAPEAITPTPVTTGTPSDTPIGPDPPSPASTLAVSSILIAFSAILAAIVM